jgi:hypothetical protein
MGNYMCVSGKNQQVQDEWQGPPAKVIRPDGSIEVYRRSITAGELMKQHPDHAVCHSSAMISALTSSSAFPADRELEGGRLYYILPAHKFEDSKPVQAPVPFRGTKKLTVEITSTPGFAQVTVKGQDSVISYSTPDLRTMYLSSRQPQLTRSNSWKPRLETINEVGAASRRHIQNFMRARSLRKSQVHSY